MACPNPHCNALLPSEAKACPRCQLPLPGVLFLGRYAIERIIRRGEFLFAYQALDTRSQQPVELCYLISPAAAARDALLAEARALERLSAPGVQGIVERLKHDPPVLVLQGATGTSCLDKLPWGEAELCSLALQVAKQLDAIHCRAIVHRDLRPEHLLIQEDSSVRIHGWGWDELLAERSGMKPKRRAEALDYMAPEASDKAIASSDLYALGMTLIHLATGKHPSELYDPLSRSYLWQDSHTLSSEFTLLIDTLIQAKASDRLPSSKILVQRLEALMSPSDATHVPPLASRPSRKLDRRLWLLLLLLLLLWPIRDLSDPASPWTWRVLLPLIDAHPSTNSNSAPPLQLGRRRAASASYLMPRAIAVLPPPNSAARSIADTGKAIPRPASSPPAGLGTPRELSNFAARGQEEALRGKVGMRGNLKGVQPSAPRSLAGRSDPPCYESKSEPSDVELRVSSSQHLLTLYRDSMVEMAFPVGLGASGTTPTGRFMIQNKAVFPDYQTPDGKIIPGRDPDNPLGTRWLGLAVKGRRGIGIHGTNEPESIGDNRSQGCIRLRNDDMETLYQAMPARAWVLIEP